MKKICVITGARSEYGLLQWLMEELKNDPEFNLQIIATGSHFSPEYGLTYKEIENDGFAITKKIEMLLSSDTNVGVIKSMGLALISFSEAYDELRPDAIMVLGDRYEMLAAVTAAAMSKIPVIHLSGGEITEGAIDDSIRHSITKLSHVHFTATQVYRKRVIQLGEQPENVFCVGEVGLDIINKIKLFNREELETLLNFKFKSKNIIVTFHPVTLGSVSNEIQMQNLFDAFDCLKDTGIIFTYPNADTGGRTILNMIEKYVEKRPGHTAAFQSLGRKKYLSVLQYVDAVVGNSSSGIVEAPSFKIGTINIGIRQKGRIRAESVIDCEPIKEDILEAFKKLYSVSFMNLVKKVTNPYGDGNSSSKIKEILKKINLENICYKKFYDVDFQI